MGNFLEDLRRKKESEEEVRRQEVLRGRLFQVNQEKERDLAEKRASLLRKESKRQFDESEIKDLIDELLKIDTKLKFSSPEPYPWHDKYQCEIEISGFPIRAYDDCTTVSIPVIADCDGVITITGKNKKNSSTIAKNLWKNNKGILEEALGKAYENPYKGEHKGSPMPSQG